MSGRGGQKWNYESLKNELLTKNELFIDRSFPPSSQSIFRQGIDSPDTRFPGRITWMRPGELVKNPQFVINKFNRHDIEQGYLGNCWFIAAASTLASSHRQLFERVVPLDQGFERGQYTGMFHFNFWWYGEWVEVIIDDYLPTNGRDLIFSSNRERPDELWPCLIEKAYAKLYGSYQSLNGGKIQDALVDMTGGISEMIDIQKKNEVSPELYYLLNTSFKMKTLMGACIFLPANSSLNEEPMDNGLYKGHAYSITGFRQIPTGTGTVNLLRLRNPWGRGEWNGPYSDKSPEMVHLSRQLQEDLNFYDRDEGEFWIRYEDFIYNFDEIQFCHLVPDALISELKDNDIKQSWVVSIYHDAWIRGVTAGGCGNYPNESSYWKNPQFYITLETPDQTLGHGNDCTLIVSLMEKEKGGGRSKVAVGFDVYKLKSPDLQPLNNSRTPKNALLLAERSGAYVHYREITKRFELKPGIYVIIPSTFQPNEEAEFMLRMFTEKRVNSGVLDEKVEVAAAQPAAPMNDLISKTFEKHAAPDNRMDAYELRTFLEEMSANELGDQLQFSDESCRSLVTLMDEDKSGFLSVSEAKQAWKEIKAYRDVFKQFDANKTNSVDTYELATMFSKLGFSVNRNVLASIVRRYGGRDSQISLTDFIIIICKLTSLFTIFRRQQKRKGSRGETADFTQNEFLEVTMSI